VVALHCTPSGACFSAFRPCSSDGANILVGAESSIVQRAVWFARTAAAVAVAVCVLAGGIHTRTQTCTFTFSSSNGAPRVHTQQNQIEQVFPCFVDAPTAVYTTGSVMYTMNGLAPNKHVQNCFAALVLLASGHMYHVHSKVQRPQQQRQSHMIRLHQNALMYLRSHLHTVYICCMR
jgi:hypothetical protein